MLPFLVGGLSSRVRLSCRATVSWDCRFDMFAAQCRLKPWDNLGVPMVLLKAKKEEGFYAQSRMTYKKLGSIACQCRP